MRSIFALFAILPMVLAIELPGEELPAEKLDAGNEIMLFDSEPNVKMNKRSVNNIAARRRSALDKTFMRFGRSDPAMRIKLNGGNLMRFGRSRPDAFMRLGRANSENFIRFGKSPNLMRFGRSGGDFDEDFQRDDRANNLMRFGRSDLEQDSDLDRDQRANLMRFGRANLMRFGRNPNMMRFGRAMNPMRFGRSDDDYYVYDADDSDAKDKRANSFLRLGRSAQAWQDIDRKNDNFMRLGRSTEASRTEMEGNEDINNIKDDSLDILFSPNSDDRKKRSTKNDSSH